MELHSLEDLPYAYVALYLQEKMHSMHPASGSGRLTSTGLTSASSLLRLGSRPDIMRSGSTAHAEGGSDDDEDPRTRRRRR